MPPHAIDRNVACESEDECEASFSGMSAVNAAQPQGPPALMNLTTVRLTASANVGIEQHTDTSRMMALEEPVALAGGGSEDLYVDSSGLPSARIVLA